MLSSWRDFWIFVVHVTYVTSPCLDACDVFFFQMRKGGTFDHICYNRSWHDRYDPLTSLPGASHEWSLFVCSTGRKAPTKKSASCLLIYLPESIDSLWLVIPLDACVWRFQFILNWAVGGFEVISWHLIWQTCVVRDKLGDRPFHTKPECSVAGGQLAIWKKL